jgi:gamma-tubulin complex component 2
VQKPLDLIISQRTFRKYQVIFRFLFQTKFAERALHASWKDVQNIEKQFFSCSFLQPLKSLINRMTAIVKNTIYYFSYEILDQKQETMLRELAQIQNFNDVIRHHEKFIDASLGNCLVSNEQVLECILNITVLASSMRALTSDVVKNVETNINNIFSQLESKDKPAARPKSNQEKYAQKQNKQRIVQQIFQQYKARLDTLKSSFDQVVTQLFQNLLNRYLLLTSKFDQSVLMLLQLFDYEEFYEPYLKMGIRAFTNLI